MSRVAIENAIKAALIEALPDVPKAWPNQAFDPSAAGKTPYIACDLIFPGITDITLSGTAPKLDGVLIATVVVASNTSTSKALQYADTIAAAFMIGRKLDQGAKRIRISRHPHIREGMKDGAYWRVPVSIPFSAY